MTRKEIEAAYTVVNGIIRSPGKFEGEPVWAPYYWEAYLINHGTSETPDWSTRT